MSLINDALRRSKQTGEKKNLEPTEGAPMQPVQSPGGSSRFVSVRFLIGFAIVALFGGLLFWKSAQKKASTIADSRGKKGTPIAQEPVVPAATPPVVAQVVQPSKLPTTQAATSVASEPSNNSPVTPIAAPAPPSAPQLKLQGIFYRLNHSTALISGKTVGAGEMILGVRVLKIDRQSVTLEWNGQTNVLTME